MQKQQKHRKNSIYFFSIAFITHLSAKMATQETAPLIRSPSRRRKEEEAFEHLDPSTRFLYKPHTLTFLLLGARSHLNLPSSKSCHEGVRDKNFT